MFERNNKSLCRGGIVYKLYKVYLNYYDWILYGKFLERLL